METFALSDYKTFDFDDRKYLFLVSQNAIFEADSDTVEMLDRTVHWSKGQPRSREKLLGRFPGTDTEKQETFERLGQIGLLFPTRGQPQASRPKAKPTADGQPRMPVKTLVLHVTDSCNLDCRYCYYHDGEAADGGTVMAPEVSRKAIDFLMDASGPLDRVELVFFGGEPLLNLKLIAQAVDYAKKAAAAKEKAVDFALTTNATLLTAKTVAFLAENRIGVTVSIDGLPEVHDRYRRFPDGSPSFEVIKPGILRLLDADSGKPVVARVTVAGDPGDVPASLDYLLDLGFAEAGFAPVTTADPAYRLDKAGMARLLDQFERLSERFLYRAREDRFLGFTNLIDLLVTLHEGEVKAYPCGAGLGLFSVSANGGIYLCQRLTGQGEAAMGDIFSGVDDARVEKFRQKVHLSSKPNCRKCWARVICAGGCYHEALVREGELTAANLHYCDWIKRWIQVGLKVYGRLISDHPEYLDKLSALRGHETRYNQVI
jgi:uncharacterized protein